MAGKRSRFEEYKSRHNGTLADSNDSCEIEAIFDRLHERVHEAMEQFELSKTRENDWIRVNKEAQKLLDQLPKEKGIPSVLTVFVLLSSLDKESNRAR
jgi:hypothetical protein